MPSSPKKAQKEKYRPKNILPKTFGSERPPDGAVLRNHLLELRVVAAVDGHSSQLITRHAHRPALIDLVLALNDFLSRLRDVGRKSKEEVFGYTLLKGHAGGRILIVAPQQGINLQTGKTGKLLDTAADSAANSIRSNHRVGALAAVTRGRLRSSLSEGNQIDDVGGSQRRVGYIGTREPIKRPSQRYGHVVLFDLGCDGDIKIRIDSSRVSKRNDAAL